MSLLRKRIGQEGEDRAAAYLARQGYRIVERNFRTRNGEIDLVALHEGAIVFVEVKTRTSGAFGAPELAVDARKQQRMVRAALGYLVRKNLRQVPCRFDVVAVSGAADGAVQHIPDAFEMDRSRL